jgi:signal transduction histidine kinase
MGVMQKVSCGVAGAAAQRRSRDGTDEGSSALQLYSSLSADRSHEDAGQKDKLLPNPSLKKVGWYAAALAGVAGLALFNPFAIATNVDPGSVQAALTLVALGVSLTVIVTGWSSIGGRIRADSMALVLAFTGIGALSAAYIVFASRSSNGSEAAFGSMLQTGMGLTLAAGVLAASYLPHGPGVRSDQRRWIATWPGIAVVAVLVLSCIAAFTQAQSLPLTVGIVTGLALVLYGWAGLRLYLRGKRERGDDLAYLLAAIVTGMLAELLLSLPEGDPQPRHLLGDVFRIVGFMLAYSALFHQVVRGPSMELQRAESALRTEQERLARARQMARIGSWDWDFGTDAIWASDEARRMFSIPLESNGMARADFENLIYQDDRARLRAAAQAALDQGIGYSIDYRILGPDGSPLMIHCEAQVERDAAGKPVRMSGIVQDITDRVAVEHALRESDVQIRRMNAELEQRVAERTRQLAVANKELEAFGYSVSHDLQAPLRRIERYAEMLSENNGTHLDDAGREMLKRIREASSQTMHLISDILKLSQITRVELRRVAVDLSALAQRVMEQIEGASTPARQVQVSVDPGIVVEADAAMLQILLENLLGNAWKFTSRTDRPSIRVGAIDPAEGKGFCISDNGAGFDMRYAYKLFGAFQRLHSQQEFKGTGIGLAIVQRIVNLHGWQIHATSEIGRGAIFTIRVS